MKDGYLSKTEYGPYRTLEPEDTLPNLAWKLDTSLPIREDEMLVRIRLINVNAASFDQISGVANGDPLEIARKITSIVSIRGKLHNPITGTGGTMMGEVEEVGPKHPFFGKVKKGTRICTLASTSMNPLVINSIIRVNMDTRQIIVDGYAILFRDSFFAEVPEQWDPRMYLALVGEAGSCYESALHCHPGDTVLLIAPSEKVGMMSMFAVRNKLGNTGRLIIVTRKPEQYEELCALHTADQVIIADFRKPMEAYRTIRDALPEGTVIDYTVNCSSSSGHEMLGVLLTKENGTVYFASPATSYSEASLGAEGIGKEISLVFYRGYIKGHVEYCISLAEKYPGLKEWFRKRYCSEDRSGIYTIADGTTGQELTNALGMGGVVISGPEMEQVLKISKRIANYDTTVLIEGESGTGKEVVADIIQQFSDRRNRPFIKINCAAIAENLFESEFFGYEAGAFTGALKGGRAGHFEKADKGTLFLDEVGELSLQNQVKLLRVLQSKEVVRVGSSEAKPVDVRLIAATNRNLKQMVEKGEFREDLYYRLNVINIYIPALRERQADIPAFIDNFVQSYNQMYKLRKSISREAMECLKRYRWPGNVRELENMVQRLVLTSDGEVLGVSDLPPEIVGMDADPVQKGNAHKENRAAEQKSSAMPTEEELYREAALKYRTTREIARALNTSQSTVVRRLKKYGIEMP